MMIENIKAKLKELRDLVFSNKSRIDALENKSETDSTVPSHVKAITQADIEKWNTIDDIPDTVFANGAGYAEIGIWNDLNPNKEDRLHSFVTLVGSGRKITIANSTSQIVGVTSSNAAFVGNAKDYDSSDKTKAIVGIVGVVNVKTNDSTIVAGDRVMSNDNGYAIKSSNNCGYRVLSIDDGLLEIVISPNTDMIQRIKEDMVEIEHSIPSPYDDTEIREEISQQSNQIVELDTKKVGYSEVVGSQLLMYSDNTKEHLLATLDLPSSGNVKINGVETTDNNIPIVNYTTYGLAMVNSDLGINTYTNSTGTYFAIRNATTENIDSRTSLAGRYRPITPSNLEYAVTSVVDFEQGTQEQVTFVEESDLEHYVKDTDYATESKAGIVQAQNGYGLEVTNTGNLRGTVRTKKQYTSGANGLIISKGTLENVMATMPKDVQINGNSIVSEGVASIPVASNTKLGVVGIYGDDYGINIYKNKLYIPSTADNYIDRRNGSFVPLTCNQLVHAVDSVIASTNQNEQLTSEQQLNARKRIGFNELEVIANVTTTEVLDELIIDKDSNGNNLNLSYMYLVITFAPSDAIRTSRNYINTNNGYTTMYNSVGTSIRYGITEAYVKNGYLMQCGRGGAFNDQITSFIERIPSVCEAINSTKILVVGGTIPSGTKVVLYGIRA